MNFDFQFSQGMLAEILEVNIERLLLPQDLGIGGVRQIPFGFPDSGESEPGVIDHVTVSGVHLSRGSSPDTITILSPPATASSMPREQTLSAAPVLVQAIVDLHLARLSDLRAAGPDPLPADRMHIIQARVTFALAPPAAIDSALSIGVRVVGVELGMLGLFLPTSMLPEGLQATLRELNTPESLSRFEVPPIVLNSTGIASDLGPDFRLWNTGIEFSPGTLTIRMQFESAALLDPAGTIGSVWLSAWDSFHSSGALSRLGGADWALFFPGRFFASRIEASIRDELTGRTDVVLNADNMPRSMWAVSGGMPAAGSPCVPGGQAVIVTLFSVSAKGQCQPFGGDIDVNCAIRTALSLPRPRTLRADVHLDYSPDDGDMAFCSLFNASVFFSLGMVGSPFAGGGVIDGTFHATTGGIVAGIITLALGYSARPPSLGSDTLHPVPGSDRDYFQEVELPVPSDPFLGTVTATGLTACSDGLAVVGTIVPPFRPVYMPGPARLDDGFRWKKVGYGCPPPPFVPAFEASSTVAVVLRHPARLEILGSVPAGYDETRVRLEIDTLRYHLVIHMRMDVAAARSLRDQAAAEGVTAPGFELLIQTNVGSRLVFVPGAGATVSDQALEDERQGARAWCEAQRALEEMIRERARFFASLMVNRLPDDVLVRSHAREWTLMVSGVAAGEVLRIGRLPPGGHEGDGLQSLAAFAPDASGLVAVRFWERPASGPSDLAVEIRATAGDARGCFPLIGRLTGRGAGGRVRGAPHAVIGCTHFERAAEFPLDGEYRGHALLGTSAGPRLALATTRGVRVYAVSDPLAPRLVAAATVADVRGVRTSDAGFLFWGDNGAWWLDERHGIRPILERAITEVLEHRRALVLVTAEEAVAVDLAARSSRRLAAAKGRAVALTGDFLRVGSGSHADTFDLARPGFPAKSAGGASPDGFAGPKRLTVVIPGLVPAASRLGRLAAVVPEREEALVELLTRVGFESS